MIFYSLDGYTTEDIVFEWNPEDPVQRNEALVLPEFSITGITTGDCTVEYVTGRFFFESMTVLPCMSITMVFT